MEFKALRRLERDVGKLVERLRVALERQERLSVALGKAQAEVERLRAEVDRYKRERVGHRKKVDALIKRFDTLNVEELDQAEQ